MRHRTCRFIEALKRMPIAIETDAANEQHYEFPPEYFVACLGTNLKCTKLAVPSLANCNTLCMYSSCLFTQEELDSPLVGDMGPVLQVKHAKGCATVPPPHPPLPSPPHAYH